jgi:hypothetical protein
MRTLTLLVLVVAISVSLPLAAEETASSDTCCHALAKGLPVGGLAAAVGTAGDKPLQVLPGDETLLEFDLPGVCLEDLINPLLRAGKIRALDCGDSFGLFGTGLAAAEMSCDKVAAPIEAKPPGDLEGWKVSAIFTQRRGERLAMLSGPEGQSQLAGTGMALASGGAKVEGIGSMGILVSRGGIDTLDGSADAVDAARLGDAAAPTCVLLEEEPANEEATSAEDEVISVEAPAAEDAPAAEADEEAGDDEEPVYVCEALQPDFVQRPLPVAICDDPDFRGTDASAVLEFGADGWLRRLVSVDCPEGSCEALTTAIRDWRVVPVEVTEGTKGRVRFTVEFKLEIPCR